MPKFQKAPTFRFKIYAESKKKVPRRVYLGKARVSHAHRNVDCGFLLAFVGIVSAVLITEGEKCLFLFQRQVNQAPIVMSGVFQYKLTDISKQHAASVF